MSLPQLEEKEFHPWSSENPFQPTTAEVYRRIQEARKQGRRLVPPATHFPGERNLDPEALPPENLAPEWEIATSHPAPRFSIIIPSHNHPEFLFAVIQNLMQSDLSPDLFEILIVQDGPYPAVEKDNLFLLKSYLCDLEPNLNLKYYKWQKKKPIFRAGQSRNLGARNARGEFLVFLDSDMLVPKDFLVQVENSLDSADLVQFVRHHLKPEHSRPHVLYSSIQKEQTFIEEEKYWKFFFDSKDWQDLPCHWKYTCTYALALRANKFREIRGFNPNFTSYGFEDTDLGYRIWKTGGRLFLNKTVLYHLTASHHEPSWSLNLKRQALLSKTAKIFFLSNLDEEIYHHFKSYMLDVGVLPARLKARFQNWRNR